MVLLARTPPHQQHQNAADHPKGDRECGFVIEILMDAIAGRRNNNRDRALLRTNDGIEPIVQLEGRGFTAHQRQKLLNMRLIAGGEESIRYRVIDAPQ